MISKFLKKWSYYIISSFIVLLIVFVFLCPMYSEEPAKEKVAQAYVSVIPLQREVEESLLNGNKIQSSYLDTNHFSNDIEALYRSSDGDIILKLKTGHMIWLHPKHFENSVVWGCLGAPKTSMSTQCS